jgi:hypothetical protein
MLDVSANRVDAQIRGHWNVNRESVDPFDVELIVPKPTS